MITLWNSSPTSLPGCRPTASAQSNITLDVILAATSEKTGISLEMMMSKKRDALTAKARRIYAYNARKMTNQSTQRIGAMVNLDHSSIINAVRVAKEVDLAIHHEEELYKLNL